MSRSFFKMNDGDLRDWAAVISAKLVADPGAYDIAPATAASLQLASDAFAAALAAWLRPETRTPIAMIEKTAARARLLDVARYVVGTVRSNPALSEARVFELGIPLRKKPGRVPPPGEAPRVDVLGVDGARVTLRLRGSSAERRGRPDGVASAGVYVAVGEESPEHATGWEFRGLATRTRRVVVDFPTPAAARTAWVSAKWFNARGEGGAASPPKRVNLPAVEALPATNTLKMVA